MQARLCHNLQEYILTTETRRVKLSLRQRIEHTIPISGVSSERPYNQNAVSWGHSNFIIHSVWWLSHALENTALRKIDYFCFNVSFLGNDGQISPSRSNKLIDGNCMNDLITHPKKVRKWVFDSMSHSTSVTECTTPMSISEPAPCCKASL